MSKFKVGDRVKWGSQAGGGYTEKVGVIVAIVNGDEPGFEVFRREKIEGATMFDDGFSRGHMSYLVSVKKSEKAKPKIYWPRVNGLRMAE